MYVSRNRKEVPITCGWCLLLCRQHGHFRSEGFCILCLFFCLLLFFLAFPLALSLPLLPIPFPLSLLYFIVLFDFEGIYANHRALFQQTHARLLAPLLLSLLLPSISRSCHTHASNSTELHQRGAGRDRCTCDHCTEREG